MKKLNWIFPPACDDVVVAAVDVAVVTVDVAAAAAAAAMNQIKTLIC